ncbi:MAG: DUF4091 domain-containing protein [Phycisphaerae bacterium]|nr:DUF4091 domain-containing protein [Phycisphaerae bacterium]
MHRTFPRILPLVIMAQMSFRQGIVLGSEALEGASGQSGLVPNASFEEGQTGPSQWKLEGGKGSWSDQAHTGKRSVAVTGEGSGSSCWRCTALTLKPRTVYRVTTYLKTSPGTGGGCLIVGPSTNNRDYGASEKWGERGFVFVTPDDTAGAFLRVGQWEVPGTVYYDDVSLRSVAPIRAKVGGQELGWGESIKDGKYIAEPDFNGEGSNEFRGLVSHTAGFNSYRWVFGGGSTVVYRHELNKVDQTSGQVTVTVGYYQSGKLYVEASKDGKQWTGLGELGQQGGKTLTVPASLFPASSMWIRLRASGGAAVQGDSAPGSLQVHGYGYEARLGAALPDATGSTAYLDVLRDDPGIQITVDEIVPPTSPRSGVIGRIRSTAGGGAITVRVVALRDGRETSRNEKRLDLETGKAIPFELPISLRQAGVYTLALSVEDTQGKERFAARASVSLPILHSSDYGYLLQSDDVGDLWWCEGTYKVSKGRLAPESKGKPAQIVAAGHEYEPFQLVLRPKRDLRNVRIEASDLAGSAGRISREHITIDRVAWVRVGSPTDAVGCIGDWPDPLPSCDKPFDVSAGTNQPLWITIYVPSETPAGEYKGSVTVTADGGYRREVSIAARVLGFALPKEAHVFATFGFNPENVRKYHNLKTEEEYRQVHDLYMKNFAAHRISPYDPMMLDPIRVEVVTGLNWDGGKRVSDEKASGSYALILVDDSTKGEVAAGSRELIGIDPKGSYILRWKAKTAKPGQQYMLTVYHHDKDRKWIPYHNLDIVLTGTGQWQDGEYAVRGRAPEQARYVRIGLRPARWTEAGENTGTAWFDDISFRQAHGGPELVKDGGFEGGSDKLDVKIDFAAFDRAAEKYLDGYGFTAFKLGVQGMGWGTFHERSKGSIGGFEQGTKEYDILMKKYLGQVEAHLRQKGWLDKAYVYWFDEPEPKDYDFVKEGMAVLKRSAPGLTRMLTEQPEPAMYGSVDLWCPLTASYSEKVCRERQALGERIMWYVCCGPKEPYATLFIDHPAIDFRMWLWQTYQHDVEGILIWESTYWTSDCAYPEPNYQNPWEDPMSWVSGYSTPVGTRRAWGNGDGRFVYPPNPKGAADKATKYVCGPVNTIRWEILRDGIEDFEYLWQLRHAVRMLEKQGKRGPEIEEAKRLTVVPEAVSKSLTEFTWDPQPLYEHRRKVGVALEGLLAKYNLHIQTK